MTAFVFKYRTVTLTASIDAKSVNVMTFSDDMVLSWYGVVPWKNWLLCGVSVTCSYRIPLDAEQACYCGLICGG